MGNVKVSIIMSVYNSQKYIRETLESVIGQTYTDWELIVIDDCGTDGSMDIVRAVQDDRIHIITNPHNLGVAQSRNIGLREAKGEYIALLDHDDLFYPYKLEHQVKFLEENPEYDVVGGRVQLINQNGDVIKDTNFRYENPLYIKAIFFFKNVFCNCEVMFRKSVADNNHIKYIESCGMEDFRFWIQFSKVGKMFEIDELFLKHRVHDLSLTKKMLHTQERKEMYSELQQYSWRLSGINLDEESAKIILDVCRENPDEERKYTISEIGNIYRAFRNFMKQTVNLDCHEELGHFCRKEIMKCIKQVDNFWEI